MASNLLVIVRSSNRSIKSQEQNLEWWQTIFLGNDSHMADKIQLIDFPIDGWNRADQLWCNVEQCWGGFDREAAQLAGLSMK